MAGEKNTFRHESIQDADSIPALLKAITASFKSGELHFSEGSDEITLNPQGLLRLKVTASKEDGRNRFTLRVTWQDEETKTNRGRKLKIGKKG